MNKIIKFIFCYQNQSRFLQTTLLLQCVIVYSIDRSITYSMKCFKVVATSTFCTNLQNIHEREKNHSVIRFNFSKTCETDAKEDISNKEIFKGYRKYQFHKNTNDQNLLMA